MTGFDRRNELGPGSACVHCLEGPASTHTLRVNDAWVRHRPPRLETEARVAPQRVDEKAGLLYAPTAQRPVGLRPGEVRQALGMSDEDDLRAAHGSRMLR